MPLWDFDPSQPIINPEAALAYFGELMGLGVAELVLPEVLVATFQVVALEHLAGRIGDELPERWPTPAFWPLARGQFHDRPLAVARLPVGAAGAAMALELMIAAGARTVFLVGSAGSLQPELPLGSLVVPSRALRHEGTSHHYLPPDQPAVASPELVEALVSAAERRRLPAPAVGPVWTTDAPYRECVGRANQLRAEGVLAVEMEAAALFAVALHRGVRAALVAAVSDQLSDPWHPGFHTLAYRRALLAAADIALEATRSGSCSCNEAPTEV